MAVAATALPYLNLRFRLSVGGAPLGDFSECTGLSLEVTTEDYHEGGENRFLHKFPSAGQPPNLVLKRGITHSLDLWNWFVAYLESGAVDPRDGQVELLGRPDATATEDRPVCVWAFTRGYPINWTGPELNALAPGVAFETLELVHRGLRAKEL
jgi:phage tail-like protein